MMIGSPRNAAFTMLEVVIATMGSVIILGALMAASIGMQKSFGASERYADTQTEERRLIDYIARDLRRAVAVSKREPGGNFERYAGGTFEMVEGGELQLKLPAYYRSNAPMNADFDKALPVVGIGNGRVDYGTASGAAPPVLIAYRKVFHPEDGTLCYVRDEDSVREVVVRSAGALSLTLTSPNDSANIRLSASFRADFSRTGGIVSVYDEVMIRNQRIDR
jgi:hypothetical protein